MSPTHRTSRNVAAVPDSRGIRDAVAPKSPEIASARTRVRRASSSGTAAVRSRPVISSAPAACLSSPVLASFLERTFAHQRSRHESRGRAVILERKVAGSASSPRGPRETVGDGRPTSAQQRQRVETSAYARLAVYAEETMSLPARSRLSHEPKTTRGRFIENRRERCTKSRRYMVCDKSCSSGKNGRILRLHYSGPFARTGQTAFSRRGGGGGPRAVRYGRRINSAL